MHEKCDDDDDSAKLQESTKVSAIISTYLFHACERKHAQFLKCSGHAKSRLERFTSQSVFQNKDVDL